MLHKARPHHPKHLYRRNRALRPCSLKQRIRVAISYSNPLNIKSIGVYLRRDCRDSEIAAVAGYEVCVVDRIRRDVGVEGLGDVFLDEEEVDEGAGCFELLGCAGDGGCGVGAAESDEFGGVRLSGWCRLAGVERRGSHDCGGQCKKGNTRLWEVHDSEFLVEQTNRYRKGLDA